MSRIYLELDRELQHVAALSRETPHDFVKAAVLARVNEVRGDGGDAYRRSLATETHWRDALRSLRRALVDHRMARGERDTEYVRLLVDLDLTERTVATLREHRSAW